MDFKSLLNSLDQLSEATDRSEPGKVKHTADPGGYGRKDDEDEEGNKVKPASTEKRGKGRPKKATQTSGEDKKYDFSAFGVKHGKDIKLPKYDKKKTIKHSLKEYFDALDQAMIAEAEQIQIKPASQVPQKPGQSSQPGQQQVAGQPQKNTQVIQQGNKTLGTVDNPSLAQQIKQSIGKGEMTLMPDQMHEEDIGKHNNATTGFDALVRKLTPKYGVEAAKRIAGAQLKKIKEADLPSHDGDMGAGLGAGRSQGVLESRAKADDKAEKAGKKVTKDIEYDEKKKKTVKEAAKPDFLDLDKDGNKKESMKKAATDKKKVKEGMDHRLKAAHHAGKAHALSKQGYNCSFDDMEEARQYHEGYKQGLDECYGQMPIQGQVVETNPSVVDDMASFGAHTPEVDEGNAFTAALARTPKGGKFSVGGKTFTDKTGYDATFESWEQDLESLLTEYKEISEGVSISSSTGQQGAPDSVSINATDADASKVLSIIKQLGLGGLGGAEEQPQMGQSSPMSVSGGDAPADAGANGIELDVVDDHDGMMDLIRKVTGAQPEAPKGGFSDQHGSEDYADEEGHGDEHGHEHTDEESCNECGMAYESCGCDDKEMVDEVESEDQMEYEVAEANAPDSGAAETTADENAEAAEDQALATADAGQDKEEGEEDAAEDKVEESYANSDDDTFEADINFMTKVISGGLNKQKSTGQTTQPVIAGQNDRMGYNGATNESVNDWKKLAGIK
jgi:hypothetical protein